MKKNISFQFQANYEDFKELYKNAPYFKTIFKLAMLGNLVALITFCGYNIKENLKYAEDGTQFLILNLITVVCGFIMYFLIRFLARFLLNKGIEKRSLHAFQKDGSPYQLSFDPHAVAFFIGKHKKKVQINQSVNVHETTRNYLFYVRNGKLEDEKFFLSKEGTLEHGQRLKRVIDKVEESGLRVLKIKG
ncbi:hypothetical protein FIU87_04745 [Bacillus sp. THAF10]|uniref:hypothetical protein n=1 Tax=Bacillus sp. THAF10 TaxID=2587848 RepID=UPI0012684100|nr:hypothetical protein [Bacillus sp. THAF10]QFT87957.1 hypothetical protein FIU87_04745 [Bacillus sp. THAF10]